MIGETVKRMRQERKLKQWQLAKLTGYSAATICLWETGKAEPNLAAIRELAKAFSVSADTLLKGLK